MFEILFVCTGNRCRSPIAEEHLRRRAATLPVKVSSVGLLDLGSAPALPEVIEVARAAGLDLTSHRARYLNNVELSAVDLVVGLERSHVAAAVVEANVPYERTFTLREIVRLLSEVPAADGDPVERARAMVARAHAHRSEQTSFIPGEDIEDPFGGPRAAYVEMAETVASLCDALMVGLFGAEAGRGRLSAVSRA